MRDVVQDSVIQPSDKQDCIVNRLTDRVAHRQTDRRSKEERRMKEEIDSQERG